MRVYFAHPVAHYGTNYEQECLSAMQKKLADLLGPDVEILNPAGDEHTVAYKAQGFSYFTNLVDGSTGVVAAPFRDGVWGMGVFTELMRAYNAGKPVFQVLNGEVTVLTKAEVEAISPLSIVDTRARVKAGIL